MRIFFRFWVHKESVGKGIAFTSGHTLNTFQGKQKQLKQAFPKKLNYIPLQTTRIWSKHLPTLPFVSQLQTHQWTIKAPPKRICMSFFEVLKRFSPPSIWWGWRKKSKNVGAKKNSPLEPLALQKASVGQRAERYHVNPRKDCKVWWCNWCWIAW